MDEITGSTFTVSNLGSYGIDEFTAIINPPNSAILAIGKISRIPVLNEKDEILVENRMKITLSCDHRVINGADGAKFLRDLKNALENPFFALL